jgi:hypothetical protein
MALRVFASLGAACVLLAASPSVAADVFVGAGPTTTVIANLTAGNTYDLSASGIVDLYVGFDGKGLTFTADGKPTYQFNSPYGAFWPNGLDRDPSQNPIVYGVAGAGVLIGTLLGSYVANPTMSDFFTIGLGTTLAPSSNVTLYGLINDLSNAYHDNGAGFTVSINQRAAPPTAAIPEPATWAMMIIGFGAAGAMIRRRKAMVA